MSHLFGLSPNAAHGCLDRGSSASGWRHPRCVALLLVFGYQRHRQSLSLGEAIRRLSLASHWRWGFRPLPIHKRPRSRQLKEFINEFLCLRRPRSFAFASSLGILEFGFLFPAHPGPLEATQFILDTSPSGLYSQGISATANPSALVKPSAGYPWRPTGAGDFARSQFINDHGHVSLRSS
ncbi:hypothetical protein B0H13DRAFT_1899805 [Mycena leptocephala]|nr:hypothetical protein B0H13DRAFT_1899805 [Mycena leptocephala]